MKMLNIKTKLFYSLSEMLHFQVKNKYKSLWCITDMYVTLRSEHKGMQ